jgi:hypothetical protein
MNTISYSRVAAIIRFASIAAAKRCTDLRQVTDTIFIKSRDWLYEQEYRRVFRLADLIHAQPDEKGKRHFFLDIDGNDIREIIFGCRTDEAYENRIKAELGRRPKTFGHVKLFRCKRHHSRFELEIIPS